MASWSTKSISRSRSTDTKLELDRDYVVPPLEGLWWADDMDTFTVARDKTKWRWTMMLMGPDWIPERMFEDALAAVRAKGTTDRLDDVRLASLTEGRCVQALHVGSFDDEGPVLERLHREFVPAIHAREARHVRLFH